MNGVDLIEWRVDRLEKAIALLDSGNANAFGRRLGYKDGTFIRQMTTGRRAISEKVIRKIEALPKMQGWFDPGIADGFGSLVAEISYELASRQVPQHVVESFLSLLRGFPQKPEETDPAREEKPQFRKTR